MSNLYLSTIRQLIKAFPAVVPHLTGRARWILHMDTTMKDVRGPYADMAHWHLGEDGEGLTIDFAYKTYDYFLRQLEGLVRGVYENNLGGSFIDVMANLISGQLTQAYEQAWQTEGDESEFPDYLTASLEDMILNQYEHVDQYFRDIVDARIDNTPIDPLLQRAAMWAGQWDTAYRQAVELIRLESGGNLQWQKGETERGCSTCAALDGIIMSAREWQELDVHPRGYPNNKLECEGGGPGNNCDCTLEPTTQRRSAGAYGRVVDIVNK